jgi:phenylacetate-CoA ligase
MRDLAKHTHQEQSPGGVLNVRSIVPGMAWPALPNPRGCQLLALQFQLEQSQWLPLEGIRQRQIAQLQQLVPFAYHNVPFYRRRLDACGLPPETIQGPEQWRQIPLLTRQDIRTAGEELHCQGHVKDHGPRSTALTSGSSGSPVSTRGTSLTRLLWNVFTLRQHLWYRRDLRLKLAAIRSLKQPGSENRHENWGSATIDVAHTGPTVGLDIHTPIHLQADWLLKHDPDYLISYPSNLLALTRHFEKTGEQLPKLREVRTFGELLEPRVRQACRRVWDVPVVDSYSCQELGYIALQCPEHEHYHVQSEGVLLEVLDPDGQPCEPGQVGRIVLTQLHNFAMPLIRYDIGDFAEVGHPCSCGRGLPVLNRIVGRQRNMFILPDGRQVWPALELDSPVAAVELPPVEQFQLIQRSLQEVELLLVMQRKLNETEEMLLRGWVDMAIGHHFDLVITYVDEIPRGANGKFEDVRSEVDPGELEFVTHQ